MANEIVTELKLVLDSYKKDLDKAAKLGEEAGNKAGTNLGTGVDGGLSKMLGGFKVQLAAVGAALGGVFTVKEAVGAAIEQESAVQKLNAALRINGAFSQQASNDLVSFADSLSRVTGVADDVIVKGEGLIATLSGLSGQALKNATQASLDLSAALGIDVDSAFNLVGKAATGNVEALGRYGIRIKSTGDAAKDFATALDLIEKKFGGFAGVMSGTFEGSLARARNGFGEILESIGNVIVKSPTMVMLINKIADAFFKGAEAIAQFVGNRDLIQEGLQGLVNFGIGVTQYVIAPLELAYNSIKLIGLSVATVGQAALAGFTTFYSYFVDYIQKPITDFIGNTLGGFIKFFNEDAGLAVQNFVTQTTQNISDGVNGAKQITQSALGDLAAQTGNAANGLFDFSGTAAAENFLTESQAFLSVAAPAAKNVASTVSKAGSAAPDQSAWNQFFASMKQKFLEMEGQAKNLGAQLSATFVTGLANSFAAMGAALAKGEDVFKAFGFALIGVLGDIALQAGATFLGLGIARTLSGDPTGPALIAAGAGLSILGGALKAFAGMGGTGAPVAVAPAPPAPGGGGVAASYGGEVSPLSGTVTDIEEDQRQRQNQVVVNIQGNVLDRRETGLAIADILNESFNSSGQTVVRTGMA